jgi:hypothetical protein
MDRQAWVSDKEGKTHCRQASTNMSQCNILMYVRIVLSAVPTIMSHSSSSSSSKNLNKDAFLEVLQMSSA